MTKSVAAQNEEIVRRYQDECMHHGRWELIDQFLAEDLVIHIPSGIEPGRGNALRWFMEFASYFTSRGIDIKMALSNEDTVFQLQELHFEHTGDFMGIPPTGKRFSIAGLAAFKIRDGKIAEHWGMYDMESIPAQLDVSMPPST
jgi:steroid delta-isomerase-like uncharacterized protein